MVVHLEPGFIKAQVEDYINCRDSFYKYKVLDCDCEFGLKYYDCLIDMLWEKPKDMDLRSLHVLYQHKIAMQYRLDYMYQQYLISKDAYEYLCSGVNELKKETHRLREMGIKHCILTSMGKGKPYEDMIRKCSILKEKEYEVFSAFAEAL